MVEEKKPTEDIELVPLEELEEEWVAEQAIQHSPMMMDYDDISEEEESDESDNDDSSDSEAHSNSDSESDEMLSRLVDSQREILRMLHENARERHELELMFEDIMKKLEDFQ